jgi:hypothetical protein
VGKGEKGKKRRTKAKGEGSVEGSLFAVKRLRGEVLNKVGQQGLVSSPNGLVLVSHTVQYWRTNWRTHRDPEQTRGKKSD